MLLAVNDIFFSKSLVGCAQSVFLIWKTKYENLNFRIYIKKQTRIYFHNLFFIQMTGKKTHHIESCHFFIKKEPVL